MEKKDISELPQVAVEYIDAVIKAMKYRKKVRAEVKTELMSHFIDVLSGCQTDEEKQNLAEDLIAEFGDAKLLGVLLKRAKKRCRPLWRTMVARLFQFVGICFLLLIVYLVWFFMGKPVITTNYLEVMNQQVRPVADESQNAWPFYKQAAEKYEKPEDKNFDLSPRNPKTLSQEERQVILQVTSKNQKSFDLIRQGNQRPYYWQIYTTGENSDKELITVLLPHLSDYRKLTYLMYWQAQLSAEQGQLIESVDNIFETYLFGQHLRGHNTALIEQLVAIAIEAVSTNTLRTMLSEHNGQIDAAFLDSTRKRFEALIIEKDFTINFESEKLFLHDEIQRSFTQSRIGKSHLYLRRIKQSVQMLGFDPREKWLKKWFRILFTHPDKEETLRMGEEFYSEMEANASKTPAWIKTHEPDTSLAFKEKFENNLFLNLLTPALDRVVLMSYRSKIDSEATLAILAILQYQKQNAVIPENLNVLVENGLLKEVPIDPFSDQPLVYKKTDGGFMLYSVGMNFIDDGGVPGKDSKGKPTLWGKDGDAVFWPVDSVNSQQ